MIKICFHGAESTGKSTVIDWLARELGVPVVHEFGREWAEEVGTDFPMDTLLAIAQGQDAAMSEAAAENPPLLLLDTDPLMTAAWAAILHRDVPPELLEYEKADHYLLFEADVPWVDDGTRFFGTDLERKVFAGIAEEILTRTGVPFTRISGDWAARREQVLLAILRLTLAPRGQAPNASPTPQLRPNT